MSFQHFPGSTLTSETWLKIRIFSKTFHLFSQRSLSPGDPESADPKPTKANLLSTEAVRAEGLSVVSIMEPSSKNEMVSFWGNFRHSKQLAVANVLYFFGECCVCGRTYLDSCGSMSDCLVKRKHPKLYMFLDRWAQNAAQRPPHMKTCQFVERIYGMPRIERAQKGIGMLVRRHSPHVTKTPSNNKLFVVFLGLILAILAFKKYVNIQLGHR